jgi:hypothetical protein
LNALEGLTERLMPCFFYYLFLAAKTFSNSLFFVCNADYMFYGVKENSKSKVSLTKEQRSELCYRLIGE